MRRVAITGLGAISGAGAGVGALWRLLCTGGTAVRRVPALAAAGMDIGPMALVPDLDLLLEDRATPMALMAAREAWADAGLMIGPSLSVGVCVGTTLGSKGPWLAALRKEGSAVQGDWTYAGPARAVAAEFHAQGVHVVSTACASGNAALGLGMALIRDGSCDIVLGGGVDALQDFVITGFGSLRAHSGDPCRPFDRRRNGLNLGEGAAFLVLEAEEHARARGQRIRAYLDGYGTSCDANHMTGPDRQGRGAARSLQGAMADAGAAPEAIDFVSLHGTATVFNDQMEALALHLALGPLASQAPVNSIKGSVGHTLGAAGALEAIMAVCVLTEHSIPPTVGHEERDPEIGLNVIGGGPHLAEVRTVLSTSSGFGGINAAILLRGA